MKKYKFFFDIEKLEDWLNAQLQKGYRCTQANFMGVFSFEKVSEDYIIRLDYREWMSKEKFVEYKLIHEDFGWEHLKGSRFGSIQCWQKKSGNQDEIFSDRQSKAQYYKRLMTYSLPFALLFLIIGIDILVKGNVYMTEGLWDMNGSLFWKALVFETPFALLRLLPTIFFIGMGIVFFKAYRQYNFFNQK